MHLRPDWGPHPAQIFWVLFNFYSKLSKSSGKMSQIDQNWGAEYGHFYFGRLKNHKITHLPPHFTMCTSIIGYNSRFINFLKLLCLIQPLTLSVSQIYAMKLRFPLRQTWVDSDFIQNIWAIIWQVGALLLPLNQVWNIFRLPWALFFVFHSTIKFYPLTSKAQK